LSDATLPAGQVEPVLCNVRDDASVALAARGADVVVNCVGILAETGRNTFDAIQAEAPGRIARIAAEAGVTGMVHISAQGADVDGPSEYSRTEGEAAVLAHMPNAMILRPSIIFGAEDDFFNRFAGMSRMGPVLPIVSADTLFQPVHVDDGNATGVYALGGPDVKSFRGLMELMLDVVRRRRLVLNIPTPIARLMAWGFKVASFLSLGIIKAPITADQISSLSVDNVVPEGARGFAPLRWKRSCLTICGAFVRRVSITRLRIQQRICEISNGTKHITYRRLSWSA